jgi:enoyl-CoA hydratase/carnithine racemase
MTGLVGLSTFGGRAEILLNRPLKRNSLTFEMLFEIEKILKCISIDKGIRVVVISGVGNFCSGADLIEFGSLTSERVSNEWIPLGNRILNFIENLPVPVIAKITGPTLGGGLELALACDIRISDGTGKFGLPESKVGAIPGWGGIRRLSRDIGMAKAKYLVLTGEVIDADRAFEWGIISGIVENNEIDYELVKICSLIESGSPLSLKLSKQMFSLLNTNFSELESSDKNMANQSFRSKEFQEGLSAFREKRPPKFIST